MSPIMGEGDFAVGGKSSLSIHHVEGKTRGIQRASVCTRGGIKEGEGLVRRGMIKWFYERREIIEIRRALGEDEMWGCGKREDFS